jgi:plastocyanin
MKRSVALVAVVALFVVALAACGDDDDTTAQSGTDTTAASTDTGSGKSVRVEVDNRTDDFNSYSIAYFPDKLTVHPGTDVKFHMNFNGEPHTVTFGSSIDKALGIFDKLTPEQQNGPPPPEVEALKIPFVIPDDADFSDPANVKFNQSAAQPCFLASGETAPGAAPCDVQEAKDAFDGSQPIVNSGLLKDDDEFDVKLADDLAPGTYSWICLFHGPEMRGEITVVADSAKADSAADVKKAGDSQLDAIVAKVKPELEKARSGAKPGEVKAGAGTEDAPMEATEFSPKEITVKAGTPITWNLSFHTVSFNMSEDARTDIAQDSDGTWHFNAKTFTPVGYTPPPPPAGGGGDGPPSSDAPPPPTNVDGGSWDGTGSFNSGSIGADGDVFFKLTITEPGTYPYVCLLHPDMEGVVKVT